MFSKEKGRENDRINDEGTQGKALGKRARIVGRTDNRRRKEAALVFFGLFGNGNRHVRNINFSIITKKGKRKWKR